MKNKNRIISAFALIALDRPTPTQSGRPQKLASRVAVPAWLRSRTAGAIKLLAVMLLLAVPVVVQAQFTYTIDNGTIAITGYTGPGGAVVIPSTITGLPVTSIGFYAFHYNTSLTSVTIPNSVTSIGNSAFDYCYSLTSVTIPDSVTNIGDSVFNACTSLTSVTIPNSVIGIGEQAFADCFSLTNVTIGNGVTNIGLSAFDGCRSLTSVTIPNSVIGIGRRAFIYCTNLTSVTIGNGVTSIGIDAFRNCSGLTTITVDALNSAYSSVDGVVFSKSQTVLIQCPAGKAGSYTIPNSVTSIGDSAFDACTSLTSVTIPNSVTSIGDFAFEDCINLTNVTIGNSVTSIGRGAFFFCSSLTIIAIPNSVIGIGELAFSYCTRLTSVTIPNSVIGIGEQAFADCFSLNNVTIANGVTNIGVGAFDNCTNLTSVTIPNSVTYIGDEAFADCASLTAITVDALNSAYSSVGGVLFNKSQTVLIQCPAGKAGTYTIPSSVTSIGDYAFDGCTSLTSVTIPNSVTYIGRDAFVASGLTSITIPNNVIGIGDSAFLRCVFLTNVTIPNSVTSIGSDAFSFCNNLTKVYFQGNAPSYVDSSAFYATYKATVYYLPGTTGWGPTFSGRPTALWSLPNPLILAGGTGFGVQTNGFGFIISWAANIDVVVEASTDLANPSWSPLQTNILTGGSSYFSDPLWTNYPGRFYRLRAL